MAIRGIGSLALVIPFASMIETTNSNHPSAMFETDLLKTHRRGALAIGALGLTAVWQVAVIGICGWQNVLISQIQRSLAAPAVWVLELSDALITCARPILLALIVATAVLFLRWLQQLVRTGKSLGATIKWTPKQVLQGFVIPGLNIKRPHDIVKTVYDSLSPDLVPPPPSLLASEVEGGYRFANLLETPAAVDVPDPSIGAWWSTFWAGGIIASIGGRDTGSRLGDIAMGNVATMAGSSLRLISAFLAIALVRGLNGRLQEWYRRVRHNSVETLAGAGIVIGQSDVTSAP